MQERSCELLAVATLQKWQLDGHSLVGRLLVLDGSRRSRSLQIEMSLSSMVASIAGVSGEALWTPHLAGSYGRRVFLER